jgi:uncharacterized membrane protein YphA (DoxX/SURF4 family)
MPLDTAFFETWRPRALAVLRIVTAYLFITHGTAKLFGIPHQAMFDNLKLMSTSGVALAVLYCFVFLYFTFSGAGAWSVDALRRR